MGSVIKEKKALDKKLPHCKYDFFMSFPLMADGVCSHTIPTRKGNGYDIKARK